MRTEKELDYLETLIPELARKRHKKSSFGRIKPRIVGY